MGVALNAVIPGTAGIRDNTGRRLPVGARDNIQEFNKGK